MIVVVATDEEYKVAKERFKGKKIIKTGVGGINVIQALRKIPKWKRIINFGYCGSNNIPIGTEVRIGFCSHYHKTEFEEPVFELGRQDDYCLCLTSDEFVEEGLEMKNTVYDMELVYICALGFKHIESIKIVSDNLSLKEYEENIG